MMCSATRAAGRRSWTTSEKPSRNVEERREELEDV
jgi:hypothetical protein